MEVAQAATGAAGFEPRRFLRMARERLQDDQVALEAFRAAMRGLNRAADPSAAMVAVCETLGEHTDLVEMLLSSVSWFTCLPVGAASASACR
jgi:hypothetical protein